MKVLLIMTDKEIFELASQHLYCNYSVKEWSGRDQHILDFARAICEEYDFYRKRCELLEKVQKYMRDPERQIVCDILANNDLLPDPSGARYGQDLRKLIGR